MTADERSPEPAKQGLLRPTIIVPAILVFLVLAALVLWKLPAILLNDWLAGLTVDDSVVRLAVGNAAQVVLFSLGGVIAIVGVGLSLLRYGLERETDARDRSKEVSRVRELAEQRSIEAERELRARFANAVTLLSDPDKPTTRQAGVYALAALADDWLIFGRPDERQVCIDVLCGYLRSSWDPTRLGGENERSIRSAGFDVIGTHLRDEEGRPTWHGARFNLRGVLVDFDCNWRSIDTRDTTIDLTGMRLVGGELDCDGANFSSGQIRLQNADVSDGRLAFTNARFSGTVLDLRGSQFSGGLLVFVGSAFSGGTTDLRGIEISSPARASFSRAEFVGGKVDFAEIKMTGGHFDFISAIYTDGDVRFENARFLGGTVSFVGSLFDGAQVDFGNAGFLGSIVSFMTADFLSGDVSFQRAVFGGGIVAFDVSQRHHVATFVDAEFSGAVDTSGVELTAPRPGKLPSGA